MIHLASDNPEERIRRAMLSLEGLSCGDSFGEQFFSMPFLESRERITKRQLPDDPWEFTDDTMMAISIVHVLRTHGEIREDRLADHFASLYDAGRGYGTSMHGLLSRISQRGGAHWEEEAGALFGGKGSHGNGSAMRVAPLGAYFADDMEQVVGQARRSALTTHAHPEAVAGAVAVAVGAALAWRSRKSIDAMGRREFLEAALTYIPESEVREGVEAALLLEPDTTAELAGALLGSGGHVSAMDTVPFVLWSAGGFLDNFEEAIWQTVSGRGDMDTTCAMVGGIVVMRTGPSGIPEEWIQRREALPRP
ncbi:ADP-ribosylglycohydrolase family protein [Granulicella sibirica]|uniref:Putative hydrolase n=1 Tax=Granulicella sibirica TaxID=2479048 RepID=A0A4Q0T2C7_9BACT|nr:ADP-ribosylglycohydrolase family protein [Granulicella sibirica]RXH57357.1 putative hydrolase [Granulicella sibirica]